MKDTFGSAVVTTLCIMAMGVLVLVTPIVRRVYRIFGWDMDCECRIKDVKI